MKAACSSCIKCGACKIVGISPREQQLEKPLSLGEKIDQYFKAFVKLNSFNGCILVHKNGKEILRKSYTIESENTKNLRVTIDSQFDIHSVAKLFANICILKLEQEGKLKRSDVLNKYFVDFPNGDKITIQYLLDHQSGLPREFSNVQQRKNDLRADQIVTLVRQEKLVFEPGTKVLYSNIGFQLLYSLIAQVSQMHFSTFLKEHVFENFGMRHSGSHYGASKDNLLNHTENYTVENAELIPVSNLEEEHFQNGHLYATADDLMLALNEIGNNDKLWTALSKKDQHIASWSGGSEGVRSYVKIDKELDYSFILLSNIDSIPLYKVVEDLPKIIKGEYYKIPTKETRKKINLSITFLKRYEGIYEFIDLNQMLVEFKVQNRKLVVKKEGDEDVILCAESATVFFETPDSEQWFEFEKTTDNQYQIYLIWKGNKWKGNKLR